jgi:hypothetical protein
MNRQIWAKSQGISQLIARTELLAHNMALSFNQASRPGQLA